MNILVFKKTTVCVNGMHFHIILDVIAKYCEPDSSVRGYPLPALVGVDSFKIYNFLSEDFGFFVVVVVLNLSQICYGHMLIYFVS